MTRFIGLMVVWNDERFVRPALEAAHEALDDIFVAIATAPWNGPPEPHDRTMKYVNEVMGSCELCKDHVFLGSWSTEADQRNAALDAIIASEMRAGRDPFNGDTWIVIVDADEVYDITQLQQTLSSWRHLRNADLVKVVQRVYFKHGDWLVTPDTHTADVFVRLHSDFRFTLYRGGTIGPRIVTLPAERLVVHHFNTVGTFEEIVSKHEHFSHAGTQLATWYETWKNATLESRDLHQISPHLLPGLRKVQLNELPPHLLKYHDDLCLSS